MRVLITAGTGFVGSSRAQMLTGVHGADVGVLDFLHSLIDGSKPRSSTCEHAVGGYALIVGPDAETHGYRERFMPVLPDSARIPASGEGQGLGRWLVGVLSDDLDGVQ